MATQPVSVQDLYPSARRLFETPERPRARRISLVWLLAGAVAALLGQRLLSWLDHNV